MEISKSKVHVHERRQLNSVTPQFDILVSKYANLIGLIFIMILRPSLVNKQLKPKSHFKISKFCTLWWYLWGGRGLTLQWGTCNGLVNQAPINIFQRPFLRGFFFGGGGGALFFGEAYIWRGDLSEGFLR